MFLKDCYILKHSKPSVSFQAEVLKVITPFLVDLKFVSRASVIIITVTQFRYLLPLPKLIKDIKPQIQEAQTSLQSE